MSTPSERLATPAGAAFIAAVAVAFASAARYGLVEPATMSVVCDGIAAPAWCVLRWLVIQSFVDARLGVVALVSALLATCTRRRWMVMLALAAGSFGLVIYSAGLAAPAVLLSALVFVRGNTAR